MDFSWNPETCTKNIIGKIHIDGCRIALHTIIDFIEDTPQDGSNMIGIIDYTLGLLGGEAITGITPLQVAEDLQNLADQALQLTTGMVHVESKELRQTVGDIHAMSWLGRYYSLKIQGAVNKCLYDNSSEMAYKNAAIEYLQEASKTWSVYSSIVNNLYTPQILTRFVTRNEAKPLDLVALQREVDYDIELV